jgi:hypothetical protein
MSIDSMARLAAADPVPELPAVESPERLRRLIEDDAAAIDLGERRHRSSSTNRRLWMRRRWLVVAPSCVAMSVVGVVLSSSSSGPGVDVAAAAYAATSPQQGIVEAVFLARVFKGSQAGGTLHQREWIDSTEKLRRQQDSTTGPYGDTHETHVLEMAFAPGRWETWSSGREARVITRTKIRAAGLEISMGFGGISMDGVNGIELYRKLYREGLMRLIGHESRAGRSLWKLESLPIGYASTDHTRLIILVDPKTFLPVAERQIDIALPGHPTMVESDLVSYRHLPTDEATAKLFDLTVQHPGARVLARPSPRFRSLRGQQTRLTRSLREQRNLAIRRERESLEHKR